MTGEVVLVCAPVSYLVGKISPDDAILIEWQLQERDVIVEMLDSLVGDDGAENQEQKQGETCNACQDQSCIRMAYARVASEAMRLR